MATPTPTTGIFLLATPADFDPIEAPDFKFHHLGVPLTEVPVEAVDTPPDDPADPVPVDPYQLFGTAGADRFDLDAGYDQAYVLVDFEPGKDTIVIDGATAGTTTAALADPLSLTADAIDGFFYNRDTGTLSVSDVLAIQFATEAGAAGTPMLSAGDFLIV